MNWIVNDPSGFATCLRGRKGHEVTIVNQSAVDVYFESDQPGRINSTAPGTLPQGTRIPANGGEITFRHSPQIFLRAISQTTVEVHQNAITFEADSPVPAPRSNTLFDVLRRWAKR